MTERTCHFICSLSAIEALGGFLSPSLGNGKRFREFVERYFPDPYPSQAGALWKLRNDAVHVFLTGPYNLMHHSGHLHLTQDKDGLTILNAEDFYAALVLASKRYFDRRLVVFFASVSRTLSVVDHCINRRLSERTKSLLAVLPKAWT